MAVATRVERRDDRQLAEHAVVDRGAELVPSAGPHKASQLISELDPSLMLEHCAVGGGAAVEAELAPDAVGDGTGLMLVATRDHEHRARPLTSRGSRPARAAPLATAGIVT